MTDADRLYRINEWALEQWASHANREAARTYLRDRRIDVDHLPAHYRIGYARPRRTALVDRLTPDDRVDAVRAGLVVRLNDGQVIDRFRDRIIVPMRLPHGEIAGFIGRAVHDRPNTPKYLNTPTTAVFRKSELLYGLHEATRSGGTHPVLVEGPVDALALAARHNGDLLPVATSGTALTAAHATRIASWCRDYRTQPVIAFDGDEPGRAAAIQAGELLRRHCLDVHIAQLPVGQDPADYLATHGTLAAFRPWPHGGAVPLVAAATEQIIWRCFARSNPDWPETKLKIIRTVGAYLRTYPVGQRARAAGVAATVARAKAGLATDLLLSWASCVTIDEASPQSHEMARDVC